ncbi:hypothetical protein PISMIDRAFT_690811 [Pisolithus microcarpus 441]|uniref:Uncharacterized protein n=1 Tax=Pisolithus microcarpus 441 TaxID=765257 RepID=A0A0C9YK16_9AGAM|nr:hypothetical protein PISMIDRAFT_690816 [Pisolithus microcarpus 441]KIK10715.1 hypothetical protein PISMIDRAFT_690811 [Pisolithus microcarpus 441]
MRQVVFSAWAVSAKKDCLAYPGVPFLGSSSAIYGLSELSQSFILSQLSRGEQLDFR